MRAVEQFMLSGQTAYVQLFRQATKPPYHRLHPTASPSCPHSLYSLQSPSLHSVQSSRRIGRSQTMSQSTSFLAITSNYFHHYDR